MAEHSTQLVSFSLVRRQLRLHQWAKNALLFVPLVLGGRAGDPAAWHIVLLGFMALGCVASSTYVVNDFWDLSSDRSHPSKRMRPLASGDLSIRTALALALACGALGFGMASFAGSAAVALLAAYVVVTLCYSFAWKRVPILDVFVLASLYTLRLYIGIVLADVRLSPWLLIFSMFVFLSLSLAKRNTEVLRVDESGKADVGGRGYITADGPLILGLGLASMMGAVIILILYLIDDAFPRGQYANPVMLWAIPPILFLFMGRVWLFSQRGKMNDDPVAFALKDRASLMLGVLMCVFLAAAIVKFHLP